MLGATRLRNRVMVAPMTTYSSQADGQLSPDELPYIRARSEGGFGAFITAACAVHPSGKAFSGQWACWSDEFLPSLRAAAEQTHAGGAAAILQIHHGGRRCPGAMVGGTALAPSAIPVDADAPVPREMTEDEIHVVIQAFADAARRAEVAGFEGVEIHGANTYLLQQFVSRQSNHRRDKWGEPLVFSRAIARAVRHAVPSLIVGYRFSPEENYAEGIDLAQTDLLLDMLVEERMDYAHASLRHYAQGSIRDSEQTEPTTARLAARLNGKIPLVTVGQVKCADDVNAALDLGAAAVAVGRVACSDPEFVRHCTEGHRPVTKLSGSDAETLVQRFHLPRGLSEKILAVPGWLEFED